MCSRLALIPTGYLLSFSIDQLTFFFFFFFGSLKVIFGDLEFEVYNFLSAVSSRSTGLC